MNEANEKSLPESIRPETLPVERADLETRLALLGATNPGLKPPKMPEVKTPRRRPKSPYGSYVMLGALAFLVGILGTITALEYSTPRVADASTPIADVSALEADIAEERELVAAGAMAGAMGQVVQLEPIDIVVDTRDWAAPSSTDATLAETIPTPPVRRAVRRPVVQTEPVILATSAPAAEELPALSEAPASDDLIASLAEPAPHELLDSPVEADALAAR
ncbi:MAG: hypothetical protein RLO52_04035 [Sandaracinaceae bacterium]